MPWIGSLVTGGGRLLLGIVEKEVLARGSSFVMTDTDSMAVIATEHGGLVACPGGPHRIVDGKEAVKALSWKEVQVWDEENSSKMGGLLLNAKI